MKTYLGIAFLISLAALNPFLPLLVLIWLYIIANWNKA